MDASSLRLCAASTLTCLSLAIPALAIDAPVAADATSRTADGFTANWSEVPGATGYLLDVFIDNSHAGGVLYTGFDGVTAGSDAAYPEGWTINVKKSDNVYTSNGNFGESGTPAIKLSDGGHYVESPVSVGVITNLAFHFRGNSSGSSTLKIELRDSDGNWAELPDVSPLAIPTTAAGIYDRSYEIGESRDCHAVRLTFVKDKGGLALDDITIAYKGASAREYKLQNIAAGDATAYTVSGLSPATYRYVVRATDGTDTSADSNAIDVEVTGVSPGYEAPDAPVALPATDVSSTGFTANWEASEGATGYALDIFRDASTTPVRETEGFNAIVNSSSGVPEGWEVTCGGCYTSDASSGAAPNSVQWTTDGQYIISKVYPEAVTNVSYWVKGMSKTGASTTTTLSYRSSTSDDWTVLGSLPVTTSGKTVSADIDRSLNARQIRIVFNKDGANMAIDDVSVAYGGESIVPVLVGAPVSGTSYTATGLSAGRYEYSVRALNGDASSDPSETISVYVGEAPHVAPVIAPLAAQTVRVGETVTVPLAITQEDGDDITATNVVAAVEPAGAYGIDAGVFTFTPAAEDLGDVSFTFTAESVGGVSAPVTLSVSVKRQRVVAVGMAGTGNRYAQDFDALGTVDCEWDDSAYPLPGWYAQAGTAAPTEIWAGTGATATSGFYSFGAADDTDRALGTLAGNGKIHRYGVAFTNDTPEIIRQVTVSFTAEQFRVGKDNNATNTLAFAWRVTTAGDMALNSGSAKSWNAVDALSFLTPATADVHGSGAVTGFSKDLSATFGIRLLPGSILLLRWADADDAGNDHAMGIDDLTVTWHHGGGTLFLLR